MKASILMFLLLMTVIGYTQGCTSKISNPGDVSGKNVIANTQPSIDSSKIVKVKVDRAGKVSLNGTQVSLDELKQGLASLGKDGVVWYYRENPEVEPSDEAKSVFEVIIKSELAIRLSRKPDYSDAIDGQGVSHPSQ